MTYASASPTWIFVYGNNGRLFGNKRSRSQQPSTLIVFADPDAGPSTLSSAGGRLIISPDGLGTGGASSTVKVGNYHNEGTNINFLDGHVANHKKTQIEDLGGGTNYWNITL